MTSILLYRPHEGEEEHQGQHSRSGRNAERAVLLFSASGKGRSLKNREIKKYMVLFFNRQNVQAGWFLPYTTH